MGSPRDWSPTDRITWLAPGAPWREPGCAAERRCSPALREAARRLAASQPGLTLGEAQELGYQAVDIRYDLERDRIRLGPGPQRPPVGAPAPPPPARQPTAAPISTPTQPRSLAALASSRTRILYRPPPDMEARLEYLRALLAHVLAFKGNPNYLAYQKELLTRVLLWKFSEITGKYTTRYRSEGALHVDHGEDRKRRAGERVLDHEHVYQRAQLADELLARPEDMEAIVARAIGCTVTKEEHRRLGQVNGVDGWERYRRADVRVFDVSVDPPTVVPGTCPTSQGE